MQDDLSLHIQHKNWLGQLDFYESEIKFFFNELDRIFDKNIGDVTTLGHSKEYADILKKKSDKIKRLRSRIIDHEKNIGANLEEEDGDLHFEVERKITLFVSDFEMMKKNFRRFASRND